MEPEHIAKRKGSYAEHLEFLSKLLYQQLDQFTDGIESFLTEGRDEIWTTDEILTAKSYQILSITATGPRTILSGYHYVGNEHLWLDPHYLMMVGEGIVDLDSIRIYISGDETLMGKPAHWNGEFCLRFLNDIVHQKKSAQIENRSALAIAAQDQIERETLS
jgi:hypothetical protein